MADLRIFIALAMFVVFALLFIERGVRPALAPLCSLCGVSLVVTLCGSLGQLALGAGLLHLLALLGIGWLFGSHILRKKPLPALGPGFWLFVAGSLVFTVLLMARRPLFTTWDEFSFWGTAAKLMTTFNELYTTAPVGWPWPATYSPGILSLSYFAQFLGEGFLPWQTYAAYNMLAFAVFAALLAPFEKKHWSIALPLAVICVLCPFVITHYGTPGRVSAVYLDALADVPMGLLFGGALAAWYGGEGRGLRSVLPAALALAVLTLAKDTGFALALVAAVIIAADSLWAAPKHRCRTNAGQPAGKPPHPAEPPVAAVTEPRWARLRRALPVCAAVFLAALVPFFGWRAHLAAAANVDGLNLGGTNDVGMLEMPLLALREALSGSPGAKFTEVMQGMPALFVRQRVSLLGTGAMLAAAILAMVALAALLAADKNHRRRCILFGALSLPGFVAYSLLIALTYIYIFRPEQTFASYERYLYPYYIGWFLAAVLLLAVSARDARPLPFGRAAARRPLPLGSAGILAVAVLFCLLFYRSIPPVYTVFGVNAAAYNPQRAFEEQAQAAAERIPPGEKTYIVSLDDNGAKWFMYCYAFLPRQVDYSFGGGPATAALAPAAWADYLLENQCGYVLLDNADDNFATTFGPLFADGLDGWRAGTTNLYRVVPQGDTVVLEPVA